MKYRPSDEIRSELAINGRALSQAREDAALFERISKAQSEVARLAKEGNALTAELMDVQGLEYKAERDALFSKFKDMRVTLSWFLEQDRGNLLCAKVVTTYERLSYNMHAHDNVWETRQHDSISALMHSDPGAYRYLIEGHPDLLPAEILALHPDDPEEAVGKYLMGLRRGYASW